MKRYYVAYPESSAQSVINVVKRGGGKNIRKGRKFGMSNLPHVILFSGTPAIKKKVESELDKAFYPKGGGWGSVFQKNW